MSLDGKIFQGRILDIRPGKEKPMKKEEIDENTPYKKQQLLKKKASAGSDFNWNSLFMNVNKKKLIINISVLFKNNYLCLIFMYKII